MSDDLAHDAKMKRAEQMREFPQTMAIIAHIRDAMAEQIFKTTLGDSAVREQIYLRVQTLDAMMTEMSTLLRDNAGEKEIEAYVLKLAATADADGQEKVTNV